MYLSRQSFLLFGQFLVSDFAIVGCHRSRRKSAEARGSTLEDGRGVRHQRGDTHAESRKQAVPTVPGKSRRESVDLG